MDSQTAQLEPEGDQTPNESKKVEESTNDSHENKNLQDDNRQYSDSDSCSYDVPCAPAKKDLKGNELYRRPTMGKHDSDTKSVTNNNDTSLLADTKIICVKNITSIATDNQIYTLFSYLGDIVDMKVYLDKYAGEDSTKVACIQYEKSSSVLLAQHITNTVFIDRALSVLPYKKNYIPDEQIAINELNNDSIGCTVCEVFHHLLPGTGGSQIIASFDPRLTALGLAQYPQLPANVDVTKLEEIRRTLYIGNLDSSLTPEQVMSFFNDIGEVRYIRMAGDDSQPTRFAFVEFARQSSIPDALKQNGHVLGSKPLKINHSNNVIVKPQSKADKHLQDNEKKVRDRDLNRDRSRSSRYDHDRERDRDRDRYRDRDRRDLDRKRDRHGSRRSRSPEYYSRRSDSRELSSTRSRDRRRSPSRTYRDRSRSRSNEYWRNRRSRSPKPKSNRRRRRRRR